MRLRKLQGDSVIDNTVDFWLRYLKSIFAQKAAMASLQINEIVIQFKGSVIFQTMSCLLCLHGIWLPTLDCRNSFGA
jgi:hypothetical protein